MSCPHMTSLYAGRIASVQKEECTLCFDNQDDEAGVNVCLHCLECSCCGDHSHSGLHAQKKDHGLVLNIRRHEVKKQAGDEPPQKITKIAIGVDGGASSENKEYYFDTNVRCLLCGIEKVETTEPRLAELVEGVMNAPSAAKAEDMATWQLELKPCPHTTNLQQVDDPPKLAAKALAHCNSCDLNKNLWLCLTCGALGCGRKYFDGSGGNNHAVEHAQSCGHHVACKLGTITPEGGADVHCYSCDDEVVDEKIGAHLAHFGIDIATQEKTDKSMSEINLEHNLSLNVASSVEKGAEPLFGPGLTGINNLGNTCYMASILQVLFSLDGFKERYNDGGNHAMFCPGPHAECYECQMGKLAHGLLSGRYSQAKDCVLGDGSTIQSQRGISPRMIKSLTCRGHEVFGGNGQQDASEFLAYLLDYIMKKDRSNPGVVDPTKAFKFMTEQRLQCTKCLKCRYKSDEAMNLQFFLPKAGEVSLDAGVSSWAAGDTVEFRCPSCNENTQAQQSFALGSTPDVLCVVSQRFLHEDWVPVKSQAKVVLEDRLDLTKHKGTGPKPTEELLPEDPAASAGPQIDEGIVQNLMSMGFPRNRCEKAAVNTGNSSAEAAAEWLFSHMEDPDIDTPLQAAAPAAGGNEPPAHLVESLQEMGFSASQARRGLRETDNNMERAVDWLFSHPDATDDAPAAPTGGAVAGSAGSDAPARFEPFAVVTHLGTSVHCGHYVVHVKKDGKWVLFNDLKVGTTPEPTLGAGYMYFLRRV